MPAKPDPTDLKNCVDPCRKPTCTGCRVQPPWRRPRGKLMVSLWVNSHTNAARIRWHLWEIDSRFAAKPGPTNLKNCVDPCRNPTCTGFRVEG